MVPLQPLLFWQHPAQGRFAQVLAFETAGAMAQVGLRVAAHHAKACLRQDCTPSLSLGPDPSRVGPRSGGVSAAACAEPCQRAKSAFASPLETRACAPTITLQRGSSACINLSRLSPFCPRLPSRAAMASRSIPIVRRLAPWVVPPLALRPRTIWPKAPLRAAFWGRLRAIRACAADQADAATSGSGLTSRAIRAVLRVAFLLAMAPAEGCASGEGA